MRRETKVMQNIKRMCGHLALHQDDLYEKALLVLKVYRDVVWMTKRRANEARAEFSEELAMSELTIDMTGRELDTALVYLAEFAPTVHRQDFENKVMSLFETRWMVELIEMAMVRVYEYPIRGRLFFEIISKNYMTILHYTEPELLELLNLERSIYFERKKEAIMLLGVALWGYALPEIKRVTAAQPITEKVQMTV